jgi:hypothetical protein
VTDENPSITDSGAFQRHVASVVLGEIGSAGFALSGSGAIREHGITDRPTRDVDLFATSATGPEAFAAALAASEDVLREHGYEVTQTRSTPQFARLLVQSVNGPDPGPVVEIDLAIDWRAEPPAQLAIGPVLALGDAVGNKVAAVYSRGEARDYLDLDAIRQSERFTDSELLTLAKEHDPGFETAMFTQQLRRVRDLSPVETAEYGITASHLEQIKSRLGAWVAELVESQRPPIAPPAPHPPTSCQPEHRPAPTADPWHGQSRDRGPRGPSL